MRKYLDAVGIITLVVMVPLCLSTAWAYISGDATLAEYYGTWKEIALLLVGFWLRGAQGTQ